MANKSYTVDEAANLGLGWVPIGHPLYGTPGFVGSETPAAAPPTTGTLPEPVPGYTAPIPQTGDPNGITDQGGNSQTYSDTPGAAPDYSTTNAGTQDVWRNTYLQRVVQPKTIDANDPVIRQQADTYAAAQERARRNQIDSAAEANNAAGLRGSGAEAAEQRLINERSAQDIGQFEATLVGRELENRRNEINDALQNLGASISNDQRLALQKELAELEASIQRYGIESGASTAGRELDLKRDLGYGGLNVDLIRALLQSEQFSQDLGYRIGQGEADYYLRSLGL